MREWFILTMILTILFFFICFILVICFSCKRHKWRWIKTETQFGFPSELKWAKEKGIYCPDFLPCNVTVYKCKCGMLKKVYSDIFTHLGRHKKEIEYL